MNDIQKDLDKIIEDFHYISNFCAELIEEQPIYYWWDYSGDKRKKKERVLELIKEYFPNG